MGLNTTPRTWVAGELVTAALLNAEIRDALVGLQAAWTAYTPAWEATSMPALGNGTLAGAYLRIGKTIAFRASLTMGSTTTYGSGQWTLSLPFVPTTVDRWRFSDALAFDLSANGWFPAASTWIPASGKNALWTPGATAGVSDRAISATVPFTWAAGDVFTLMGMYETAAA